MNYSRQRELILDTLMKNPVHPTAEELFAIIKKKYPEANIGIATVYRNLSKLADLGIIKRISCFEYAEHFDHNTFAHNHFMCKKCKNIFDINSKISPELIKKVQDNTGSVITGYDIIFYGICSQCQSKQISI